MKKFLVNSAILSPNMDPMACAVGAPKMLINAGIKDVKIRSCYCCGPDGRIVLVAEANSREALLEALNKISLPVASILEVEEIKQ